MALKFTALLPLALAAGLAALPAQAAEKKDDDK